MKRLFGVVILLLGTLNFLPVANADSKVADCIELRNPTSKLSATLITLSVDVYAICTPELLGRGNGQKPLYTMPEEESLFNLNSCNGPSVAPLIGNGRLGTATCSLRIGSNTLPSPRAGATSTRIKVWFAWDFSAKTISVSHGAIPAATNNGWGGSSGGGQTGGGTSTPLTPSCTGAPNIPVLTVDRNSIGPKFNFSLSSTGPKATSMYWSYALWDSNSKSWGVWTDWTSTSANSGSHQATAVPGKSLIAFAVYARNACGSSEQAREAEDQKGISLAALTQDVISKNLNANPILIAGQDVDLYLIATSKYGLELTAVSATPTVCVLESSQIFLNTKGTCTLLVSSVGNEFESGAKSTEIQFEVSERKSQQIPNLPLQSKYELTLNLISISHKADSGLPVEFVSLTPQICQIILGKSLYLQDFGKCTLQANQDGDEQFLPAPARIFELVIVPEKSLAITCTKGKLVKKISGKNPKCPAGYKVKK